MKKYTAFHFSNKSGNLGFGDGREIRVGETLSVDCKPKLCEIGLHGSQSVVDALGYASGARLWKVEIWGNVDCGDDKLCGNNRRAVVDYGEILPIIVEFAKWCSDRAAKYAGSAAKSAKYAAEYAESAAKSAKSAKYAAKSAAEYTKSAAKSAKYAAKYAESAAKYAESAAKKERDAQEKWWMDKLSELKEK